METEKETVDDSKMQAVDSLETKSHEILDVSLINKANQIEGEITVVEPEKETVIVPSPKLELDDVKKNHISSSVDSPKMEKHEQAVDEKIKSPSNKKKKRRRKKKKKSVSDSIVTAPTNNATSIKITIATNKVPTLTKAKTDIRHNGQVQIVENSNKKGDEKLEKVDVPKKIVLPVVIKSKSWADMADEEDESDESDEEDGKQTHEVSPKKPKQIKKPNAWKTRAMNDRNNNKNHNTNVGNSKRSKNSKNKNNVKKKNQKQGGLEVNNDVRKKIKSETPPKVVVEKASTATSVTILAVPLSKPSISAKTEVNPVSVTKKNDNIPVVKKAIKKTTYLRPRGVIFSKKLCIDNSDPIENLTFGVSSSDEEDEDDMETENSREDEDNNDDKYVPTMKEFDADAARRWINSKMTEEEKKQDEKGTIAFQKYIRRIRNGKKVKHPKKSSKSQKQKKEISKPFNFLKELVTQLSF